MSRRKPLVLTILDGWGYRAATEGNAIALARKPTYDSLLREFPNALVHTSGKAVGLPDGQMGNSEVGHLNIGAGRVVHMDVTRLDLQIENGEFFQNPALLGAMKLGAMKNAATHRLHLLGLCSTGGVHSSMQHLFALLKMAKLEGVNEVFVHCFMDGRDTGPNTGAGFIQDLQKEMSDKGVGRIASLSGRYFAMDRDKRWERIEKAFGAMTKGDGVKYEDPLAAVKASYEHGVTDEFIEPVTIVDAKREPVGLIREDDSVIFFNYRADRAREMTEKIIGSMKVHYVTMTQYDRSFPVPFVLPKQHPNNILANVFAQLNWANLRIAETEKYAHVTYFFNGGIEAPFAREEREMVASPKVATYDLKPEMSAQGILDLTVKHINQDAFDVIVMNFANADMVGHSGRLEPTIRAVETVDACLSGIYQSLKMKNFSWLITADHGNAEMMIDPVTGTPHTYHTTNPVPFLLVDDSKMSLKPTGALQDIAPTVLGILGVEQPKEMTGQDMRIPQI
jgi:2,3-bisphosphoglycerate-independent phosphoglycerate mutase